MNCTKMCLAAGARCGSYSGNRDGEEGEGMEGRVGVGRDRKEEGE